MLRHKAEVQAFFLFLYSRQWCGVNNQPETEAAPNH